MKCFRYLSYAVISALLLTLAIPNEIAAAEQSLRIGIVDFKACVEKSKLGKKEQANFDSLKKQMEGVLEEKEKALTEVSNKINDPDYLDSLSPQAEAELKHKSRTLSQEFAQHQQQFYQMLNQANFKIIQKINEFITKASKTVASNKGLDLIIHEEGVFYFSPTLDVSNDIVRILDEMFANDEKK
jgi:outer membrane protein